MSKIELSYAARVALISLRDQPEYDTPEAISAAPLGLSPEDVTTGLQELHAHGLALRTGDHWQLTQNGARHEPRRGGQGRGV